MLKRISLLLVTILLAAIILPSCASPEIIATIDGVKITADEYSFYLAMERVNLEGNFENPESIDYTSEIDDGNGGTQKLADMLKERAFSQLCFYHAFAKFAEDNGITLTEEDEANIKTSKDETITNQGGKSTFIKNLKSMGTTEKGYDIANRMTQLVTVADPILFGDEGIYKLSQAEKDAIKSDFETNYYRSIHIVKYKYNIITEEKYEDADLKIKKSVIESALKELKENAADFDSLVSEYTDEEADSTDIYFSAETILEDAENDPGSVEYLNAVKALKEGEYSGVLDLSDGYYIIKRLKPDAAYIDTLTDQSESELVNKKIQEIISTQKIEKTSNYTAFSHAGITSK